MTSTETITDAIFFNALLDFSPERRLTGVRRAAIMSEESAVDSSTTDFEQLFLEHYPRLVRIVDWRHTDVFFGDERAVPPDDAQSNYRMARETLLAPAHVPDANVFRWRAESADLDAAARDYERELRARPTAPRLDLALLGLGPDGHTASLFPGTAALGVEDRLAVANDVPQLGTRRLTLTYPVFREAGEVFFLVTGRDKHAALADVVRPGSTLPAARIIQRTRSTCIFCDRDAAQDIKPSP